MTNLLNITYF